jgi:hypothetical protein
MEKGPLRDCTNVIILLGGETFHLASELAKTIHQSCQSRNMYSYPKPLKMPLLWPIFDSLKN